MKQEGDPHPVMYGMNSRLVKADGNLQEKVWKSGGLYGAAIDRIIYWLEKATGVAENGKQAEVLRKLIEFYRTGDLKTFDEYTILWVQETEAMVDFTNGFTETYGDPLGLKASWEGYANFKDLEATARTEKLSANAQWFEDHSPVDDRFKKAECRGVVGQGHQGGHPRRRPLSGLGHRHQPAQLQLGAGGIRQQKRDHR